MDVFDIIARKNYFELTDAERAQVNEVCDSEEAFNQMKWLMATAPVSEEASGPSDDVKDRLDNLFAQQSFPKVAPIWYNALWMAVYPSEKPLARRPLIQAAAIMLLLFTVYPFLPTTISNQSKPVTAKVDSPTQEAEIEKRSDVESQAETNSMDQSASRQSESVERQNQEIVQTQTATRDSDMNQFVSNGQHSQVTMASRMAKSEMAADEVVSAAALPNLEQTTFSQQPTMINGSVKGFVHPDGIFKGDASTTFSVPVSEQEGILDLLTVAY